MERILKIRQITLELSWLDNENEIKTLYRYALNLNVNAAVRSKFSCAEID